MNIIQMLSEGNRRSLGRANEVALAVSTDQKLLPDLFVCLLDKDEVIRLRASDALEKVCRQHPDWLVPYADRLLNEVSKINQPSVQWHLAQMLGQIPLSQAQQEKAVRLLKNNLETKSDWIVLNYSLEAFVRFADDNQELKDYFIRQLKRHSQSKLKSVAGRATRLLGQLS